VIIFYLYPPEKHFTMKSRRTFKRIFFAGKLHYITPEYFHNFFGHLSGLSKFIHKHKNQLAYNDFCTRKFEYSKRYGLFSHVIESENLKNINYLEFGVENGSSFKWWIKNMSHPDARFYGFDTFTGLPEAWGPYKKGAMAAGEIPKIEDSRHQFIQGLFQQSLPDFLKTFDNSKRNVIHLDADLYSSTYYVLNKMHPFLKPGDILLFDEFNVPMHEYKAFTEFVSSCYIEYEILGAVNNFYQIAVKIK